MALGGGALIGPRQWGNKTPTSKTKQKTNMKSQKKEKIDKIVPKNLESPSSDMSDIPVSLPTSSSRSDKDIARQQQLGPKEIECEYEKAAVPRAAASSKTTTSETAETTPRFLVVKRTDGEDFSKVSPFVISKSLYGLLGKVSNVKKIKEGLSTG